MSTMNKIKDALHLNKDKDTTTTGTHTAGTTHNTTHTGTHTGTSEGVAGPHSSRVANAADPRIDSDLDGSHSTAHTHGAGTHVSGTHNASAYPNSGAGVTGEYTGAGTGIHGGSSNTHGSSTTTAGPHSNNLLNKVDPRVDSNLDGSKTVGGGANQHTTGAAGAGYGSTGTGIHSGTGHTTGTHTGAGGILPGQHSTNTHSSGGILPGSSGHNNNDGIHSSGGITGTNYSSTTTGTGTHGGISHSTNAGPHNSAMANKADPRVDSTLTGSSHNHGNGHSGVLGAHGSHATPGSGTAQNTAGPHNNDMLNKIDPRVDSDLDGSKTVGGNKTHA